MVAISRCLGSLALFLAGAEGARHKLDKFIARESAVLTKVLLPHGTHDGGVCMDGTQAGYYYGSPSSSQSTDLVIHLSGGGACITEDECEAWAGLNDKGYGPGSSSGWQDTKPESKFVPTLGSDPEANPYFHNAHHVSVPYCTGDMHSGQATEPKWGWIFDGHLNIKAIVNHLIFTIKDANNINRVLFMGSSAGALGTLRNCDWVASYLAEMGSSAEVKCAAVSGFFFSGNTQDNPDPQAPPTMFPYWSIGQLTPPAEIIDVHQTFIPENCLAKHPIEKCGTTVAVLYPYIKAPVFIFQDAFDKNNVHGSGGLPLMTAASQLGKEYIAYYGNSSFGTIPYLVAQKNKAGARDGLLMTSCMNHGHKDNKDTRLGLGQGEVGFEAALGNWFFEQNLFSEVLVDDCVSSPASGLPCNPTCKGIAPCYITVASLCGDEAVITVEECNRCVRDYRDKLSDGGCSAYDLKAMCSRL